MNNDKKRSRMELSQMRGEEKQQRQTMSMY